MATRKPSKAELTKEAETITEQYSGYKRVRDDADKECTKIRARLRDIMEELNEEAFDFPAGKVAYVAPSSEVLDQEKLRARIGEAMWKRITTRVLDKNKLSAHIKSKEIDPKVVARCTNEVPGTAYAKVTPK